MSRGLQFPVPLIIVSCVIACFNFLASALCLFAFQTLIRNSSIRKNSYNIYVIFLIFPDALQNMMMGLGNVFFENGAFIKPQGFYEINVFIWFFYFLSNFYLNAAVAYEINSLVTASYRRQKTRPPELERAWKQVALVYLFATIIGLWMVLPYKWSPVDIVNGTRGDLQYGSPNGGVFGPMAAPLIGLILIAIPITYVLYIRARIAWRKLLPKRGRTRVLSLFFMRIIIVFLLFYLPNTVLTVLLFGFDDDPTLIYLLDIVLLPLLNSCQAYVTLYMVLWKDDIRKAVANEWNRCFGKCCCHMKTTVPQRPSSGDEIASSRLASTFPTAPLRASAGSSSRFASRPWGYPDGNSSSMIALPSSTSNSNPTDSTLSKKSEWDEEDLYKEENPDPTGSLESGSDPEMPEDHPSALQDDEENPSNWVVGTA